MASTPPPLGATGQQQNGGLLPRALAPPPSCRRRPPGVACSTEVVGAKDAAAAIFLDGAQASGGSQWSSPQIRKVALKQSSPHTYNLTKTAKRSLMGTGLAIICDSWTPPASGASLWGQQPEDLPTIREDTEWGGALGRPSRVELMTSPTEVPGLSARVEGGEAAKRHSLSGCSAQA